MLKFESLRGQVKARYLPEGIDGSRQYFNFPYKFLGIIDGKRLGQAFWIMIWIYYYLLKITLDLHLDKS